MTEQPPYIPGAPPQMGPTLQQLARPTAQDTSEPKKRRKQRAAHSPKPLAPPRRKKSQAAPSKPRRAIKRRATPAAPTASAAVSPAMTSDLGIAVHHAIEVFKIMPEIFRPIVLEILHTIFPKKK